VVFDGDVNVDATVIDAVNGSGLNTRSGWTTGIRTDRICG
jgi:hypothetical protein